MLIYLLGNVKENPFLFASICAALWVWKMVKIGIGDAQKVFFEFKDFLLYFSLKI